MVFNKVSRFLFPLEYRKTLIGRDGKDKFEGDVIKESTFPEVDRAIEFLKRHIFTFGLALNNLAVQGDQVEMVKEMDAFIRGSLKRFLLEVFSAHGVHNDACPAKESLDMPGWLRCVIYLT